MSDTILCRSITNPIVRVPTPTTVATAATVVAITAISSCISTPYGISLRKRSIVVIVIVVIRRRDSRALTGRLDLRYH